jgi:hypothetical protein
MFYVYQPMLTDAQVNEVNARGWDAHPAYAKIDLLFSKDDAWDRIKDALAYYHHAATVDCATPDEVFEVTNIGPEYLITRHGPMRSGSVGDVLIATDHSAAYVCLSFGWLELTREQFGEFQMHVSTCMGLGEVIATA